MFTRRRQYPDFIEGCVLVSAVCLALVIASLCTDEWITAAARVLVDLDDVKPSSINYGLFTGKLTRRILDSPQSYDIYITCDVKENSCLWSCETNEKSREYELKQLLSGVKVPFGCLTPAISNSSSLRENLPGSTNSTGPIEGFLNAGMYYSHLALVFYTLIELCVLLVLSLINCLKSPVDPVFNTKGISITANATFVSCLVALILYGCNYDYWIKDNVGIRDTIVGQYASDASLGLSYWLFATAGFLTPLITLLLLTREQLLRKDRAEIVVVVAQVNDPTTVLY